MIIEEYDPESEEPREVSLRDKIINWVLFIIVIATLGYLAYAARQIEENQKEIECFEEPITTSQISGIGIPFKLDLDVSVDNETYHNGDNIQVKVVNLGENAIWFPKGFNLEVHEKISKSTYISIKNKSGYRNNYEIILSPVEIDPDGVILHIKPDLIINSEPKEITVSFYGFRYENEMYCMERHDGGIRLTILP